MKATQGTTYRMLGSRVNDVALQLEELRTIGATGKKLNRASDDPASVRPVLNTRKQISNIDRNLETMGKSLDTMQATDGHLEHVENIMQRTKEIMTNAINGAMNDDDLTVLADEIAQLRNELLDSANGMVDGKYLFGGYEEDTVPFVENPSYDPLTYDPNDSATWPYLYQGDENATSLEITTGERLTVNLTGNDLFFGTSTWDTTTSTNNSTETGRYDLFLELTQAEEALRSSDQVAMQTAMDDLEGAAEQNRRLRSQLGNRASRVETAMDYQEGVKVDLSQVLSRYEDADAVESFNAIIQQETAFQAALSVTAQVSSMSILDFI
ncbi:flagellar hook-associated protein FlgL [Desulfobulbus rhabdoformis]|uniref:flagellar hook-associated protein FlgL n=1 Tax=Desulfobulbus rhabdoformis TaxID=34032 RepID=UPI001962EEC5|nr:flagellar hook-associated protein FlgL [Desulfobulbus rhabdoformis]MBM9616508.1 flagellar hook-associated protein FlgL [Desulfobulbus rhabdoformis]